MLGSLPLRLVDEITAASVVNGASIAHEGDEPEGSLLRIVNSEGDLMGVYRRNGSTLRADVVLAKAASV